MSSIAPTAILHILKRLYTPPRSFLAYETPLDLLVATILSAQCTDARVNLVTPKLFALCRSPEDYLRLSRKKLETLIHSCGTFRNKAKFIHGLCKILLKKHRGKVPQTMEELTELPGVGRKTAAIILYAAFGKNEAIAVDTHVGRLSLRLGLSKGKTPEKIEKDLLKLFPQKDWGLVNTLMISHGRAVCMARNRQCGECVFKKDCPSSLVGGRSDLARDSSRRR
ncbi:MAG: endonuclease III [Candidatus Peregrinibacteria bacterium]